MRFRPLYPSLGVLLSIASPLLVAGQTKPSAGAPASPAKPAKPAAPVTPVPAETAKTAAKSPLDAAGIEFFEKKVRPVLVAQCYECHSAGAKKSMGQLTLDTRGAALKGGLTGPAVMPGHPETSRLITAIGYGNPDLTMPPKAKLSDAVIADLTQWVKMGAPWPESTTTQESAAPDSAKLAREKKKREHWAFQPVTNPKPPAVKTKGWVRNPIDQFILAKMEAKGLKPVPAADRRTLIRRAYFDLVGLPPTPEEVEAFVGDKSPNAWPALVDRLLASPHYGERWGRFWLDVARFGEDQAHTFEARVYPQGFRYRDWVAKAFNSDMPYDRFIKEQLAADLLNEPDLRDQLPALGMFGTGPVYYGDEKMFDQYDDRIDTLSRGFLGLTAACARCHDHKFDPISQKDYYGLAGVFASTAYIEVPLGSDATANKFGKAEAAIDRRNRVNAQTQAVDKYLTEQEQKLRNELPTRIEKLTVAAWKLRNRRKADPKVSLDQISAAEGLPRPVLERWVKYLDEGPGKSLPQLAEWRQMVQREDPKTDLSGAEQPLAEARKLAAAFQAYTLSLISRRSPAASVQPKPQPLDKAENDTLEAIVGKDGALAVPKDQLEKALPEDARPRLAELKSELERVKSEPYVHALAEGTKIANVPILLRGNIKTPGEEAPRHFLSILAGDNAPAFQQGSGRLELANAIADPKNPLTARVMVNRVWQHHFGTGIVRTTSNFGLLGELPTHPELLDYLATQFVEHGWSVKELHRQMMLSATYQAASAGDRRNEEIDPDNRYLWHMRGRRLEVEAWRDAMLAVSDKLDRTVGGPSLPLSSTDNRRRTFYATVSRHDLDPMLRLFDFPDANVTSDQRASTTVPLQELFVLNSEFMVRQAKAFAARLTSTPDETDSSRIRRAFLLAYGRPPSDRELLLGLTFLQKSPTETGAPNANKLTRWEEYAQVLLSANEFMYID